MVVTVMWKESWVTVAISLCVLLVLVLFVLFCSCCDQADSKTLHRFYVLDENGMKKATEMSNSDDSCSSHGFFKSLSRTRMKFPLNNNDCEKILSVYERNKSADESALLDSTDLEQQFNHAVLRIDIEQADLDEVRSCASTDSRHSFFSVYPISRTHSVSETMKSALSGPEDLDD